MMLVFNGKLKEEQTFGQEIFTQSTWKFKVDMIENFH